MRSSEILASAVWYLRLRGNDLSMQSLCRVHRAVQTKACRAETEEAEMTFLFEYPYKGSMYSLDIVADSEEEAIERVKQIVYAKFIGTLVMKLPAQGSSLIPRFICWWRNQWRKP